MGWGRHLPVWLLVSVAASGAPRTVTIAAGDCKNPELTAAAQVFALSVAGRPGIEVLSSEAVLERFRPVPAASAEDLARQLEAAQTQFYAGTHDKALETLRAAAAGIERLSVRAEPWKLLSRQLMLQALVEKALNKKTEANDAQKRVLRIEPQFKLDADYYTPATITAFEAIRKEVQRQKKVRLTITSQPGGAEVFVDGALLGKTPFSQDLVPGEYQLALAAGPALSFTRQVKLSRDEALQIDLAFEGALSPQAPLCVSGQPNQLVDTALKLAALAGADNVVVLRSESRNNEPGWVTATLLEVNKGTKVRDGGIRFTGLRRNETLAELAGFILTGKGSSAVVTGAAPAPAKADVPVASEPPKSEPPPKAEPLAPAPLAVDAPAPEPSSGRGMGPRIVGIVLMGAGAIVAGSAGGLYASGGSDRAALAGLLDDQGRVKPTASQAEASRLDSAIDSNAKNSLIVGVTGGAVAVVGLAVFLIFPPQDGPQVGFAPTRDGFWVGTSFSF